MAEIPVIDLKAQYRGLQAEIDQAVLGVLAGGSYILGKEVSAFEGEFAEYCGVRYAVGVSSGTAAITLALAACGIGRGDEVILPAHTAIATLAAVELAGATPVLVDIEPRRFTIDPEKIVPALTLKTRAVIPVHLYGCPADLTPLLEIARQHGLTVIEDCAQAHGASYRNRPVGSFDAAGAFSFYPTKNLGAFGDGGAVVTNDPETARRVRLLRQYGWEERYVSALKGTNSRLDDIQAAVLRVKLRRLDEWNARRWEIASCYLDLLAESGLILPIPPEDSRHVFHQFVVRHPERDRLWAFLKERGIQTLIHYPLPIHLQPAYTDLGYGPGDFPAAEQTASEVLSLPIYPEMTDEMAATVCEVIKLF
jgi:dTDP-4-amino-4,6-dideoxygalactose transaminase